MSAKREYKLIVGPTWDRLELLVNRFLAEPDAGKWDILGPPNMFGHEQYIQAFFTYEDYE